MVGRREGRGTIHPRAKETREKVGSKVASKGGGAFVVGHKKSR